MPATSFSLGYAKIAADTWFYTGARNDHQRQPPHRHTRLLFRMVHEPVTGGILSGAQPLQSEAGCAHLARA